MAISPTPATGTYNKRRAPEQYDRAFFDVELANIQRAFGPKRIRTVTSATTATAQDHVILCDPTSGAITVTFPPAVQVLNLAVTVKQITSAAHTVTIGATVDGVLNPTLGGINKAKTIESDGSAYYQTGQVG